MTEHQTALRKRGRPLGESLSSHNLLQGLNVRGLGRAQGKGICRGEGAREVLGWEMLLPRLPALLLVPDAAGSEPERRLATLGLPPF